MQSFLASSESLKNTPRRGWVLRGVTEPESVADHMYQMTMILQAYPWENPADRHAAIDMALFHDVPKAVCGDIAPSDGISKESKRQREGLGLEFLTKQVLASSPDMADRMKASWGDYDAHKTDVARIVHQVDKLEALQQAFLYTRRNPGLDLTEFKNNRAAMTDSWLRQRADEILRKWDEFESRKESGVALIFVIGGPGVGKGTQCTLTAKSLKFKHISVGDLLRKEAGSTGSLFADFILESFRASIPVPPALTMELLQPELEKARKVGATGILLDGFPRSIEQLVAFEEQISNKYSTIVMDCPNETLIKRLLARAESSGRVDDTPDSISTRLVSFQESNKPIRTRLSRNNMRCVNCTGSIDVVQQKFIQAVQELCASKTALV